MCYRDKRKFKQRNCYVKTSQKKHATNKKGRRTAEGPTGNKVKAWFQALKRHQLINETMRAADADCGRLGSSGQLPCTGKQPRCSSVEHDTVWDAERARQMQQVVDPAEKDNEEQTHITFSIQSCLSVLAPAPNLIDTFDHFWKFRRYTGRDSNITH